MSVTRGGLAQVDAWPVLAAGAGDPASLIPPGKMNLQGCSVAAGEQQAEGVLGRLGLI